MPFNVEFEEPVTELDTWDNSNKSFEGPMDTFAAE